MIRKPFLGLRRVLPVMPRVPAVRTVLAALALAACAQAGAQSAAPARAAANGSADDTVLAAQAAFRAGDALRLARHAAALEGHVLHPYAEYWRLKLRLDEQSSTEVRAYLAAWPGSYLADRLRADWLKELGKRRDWQTFDLELAPLVVDDAEIRCYALASRLARNDTGVAEALNAHWLEAKELPEGCVTVAEAMMSRGTLTARHVWQRARLLLDAGQVNPARRTMGWLPPGEAPDAALLNLAATSPARVIANPPADLSRRANREMLMFALSRHARNEPRESAEALEKRLAGRLPAPDAAHAWGRIAFEAAKRHLPEAVKWFERAGDADLGDEAQAWKVRAALRAGQWPLVQQGIDAMSVAAHADHAWSYWYGRALAAQGKADGARAYYLRVAGQPTFYGMLATEELGQQVGLPAPLHQPSEAEVAKAKEHPGIARALALYRLNLRTEGTREWFFTIRSFEDPQLLAAAELARRHEIYDRTINTADRTSNLHNYGMRYLAPFREVFREYARAFDIEEAWLFGLTRQESRFIANAKSSAGAQGLMQLMPATARWVAKKVGLADFQPGRVTDVQTNVTLGARYLKMVLDELGHPVMASAAYNAGPGRARRWRDVKPLEGAIYAESIPFNETRDYVKRVMANTMYYAMLLDGKSPSLKTRMGTIAAKASGEKVNEELP